MRSGAALAVGVAVVLACQLAAANEIRVEDRDGVLYVRIVAAPPAEPPPIAEVAPPAAAARPASAAAVSRRRPPYADLIREAAERYALPPEVVESVIWVESNFEPRAVSSKGARGLMQLMPGTAAMLGVRNAFDVRQNIDGGTRHLRDLIDRFRGDLSLALAAYNAGAEAVVRHGGIPPYAETQAYVAKIGRLLERAGLPLLVAVAEAAPSAALAPQASAPAEPAPAPEPPDTLHRWETRDGRSVYSNLPPDRLSPSVRRLLDGDL